MNKVVLVTGSTSGIGLATAKLLHDEGMFVFLNGLESEFESENNVGSNSSYFKADISKKVELEELKKHIIDTQGRLDYLVAHAGVLPVPAGIGTISEIDLRKTIDTNLVGTYNSIEMFGKYIQETSKNGAIVATASVDGIIGEPFGTIYSATKAGILSMIKSFARHFDEPLVRVNGVAPGLIDTPLTDSTGESPSSTTDVSIIKRIGKPEEIASVVKFLLSDDASFITGQTIVADGGFVLK